jgi:putative phage-type endonuclease
MKTIALQQGSDEWLAHRRTTRNASEAPAMMGASPYVSRSQLLHQLATGIEREIDDATQRVFTHGHAVEPKLRAIAESIIGEDLYPVTGVSDDGYLGASFDGVTLGEDVIFEAKQSNQTKVACIRRDEIPPADYWQIVQQFAVCTSAERCLYLVGDGTEDDTAMLSITRDRIAADIPKLLAGWQQFDADVAAYVPEPVAAAAPTGRAPETLPALSIQVTGMVTASNLAEFKANALAVLGGINRKLTTDEDFADAEKTVKWCQGVEERLAATKQQVLGQTADIDAVFRTMDEVSAETRRIRLDLDKLVTREKENRKLEIVNRCKAAYEAHVTELRAETNGVWLNLNAPDLAGAIRGKKSLKSMQDACDTVLAQAKIAANESARHIRAALACLSEETAEHKHLFPDYLNYIAKPVEDIRALVRGRIAEHKQREEQKAEQLREQIRKEEADKLAAEHPKAELAKAQAAPEGAELSPAAQALNETHGAARFAERHPTASPAAAKAALPIKLGQINEWLAPLSISADGLATLGFQPAQAKGAAKLYAADDFPRICAALVRVVNKAQARAAEEPIADAQSVRTAA